MYIQEYRNKIELELTQSCQRICYILDSLLIKKAENIETKIFYRKLKGDLNRYVGEYAKDDLKEKVMKDGLTAYQEAIKMSKELPILNEVLLGLSLNMSLFYYEVMKETKKAIEISNECAIKIDKELPNFDATNENNKVIITLVNLIKDNLAHWKAEEAAEQSNNKKIINN